jgi:hypothetical protein
MEAILAHRFAPLNFSVVPSFPNLVLPSSEWMDYLHTFKEDKGEILINISLHFINAWIN